MWNTTFQRTASALLAALMLCTQLFADCSRKCSCGSFAEPESAVSCCMKRSAVVATVSQPRRTCCTKPRTTSNSCGCQSSLARVADQCGCGCVAETTPPPRTTESAESTRLPRQTLAQDAGTLFASTNLAHLAEQHRQLSGPSCLTSGRTRQLLLSVWQI